MTVDEWLKVAVGLGLVVALVGAVLLLGSLAEAQVRRRLREAPRLRLLAGLGQGTATFEGRALPLRDHVPTAPLSRRPAVFFRAQAYRSQGNRKMVCIATQEHTEPWRVQDADGTTAIVASANARIIGVRSEGASAVFAAAPMHVAQPADLQGVRVTAPALLPSANDYCEESIGVGEPVTVNGVVVTRPDGLLEIVPPADDRLLALVGTADAFLGVSARRRRRGAPLFIGGSAVAVVLAVGLVLWKADRSARGRARVEADTRAQIQMLESRLDIVERIEADAATRPLVGRTTLDPLGLGTKIAVIYPAAFDVAALQRGIAAPQCKATRGAEPERVKRNVLHACTSDDVLAIVRARPDVQALRFGGDALVYDLADGRYLGAVVLEIPNEAHQGALWSRAETMLRVAVEGVEAL